MNDAGDFARSTRVAQASDNSVLSLSDSKMADYVGAVIKWANTRQSAGIDPLVVSEFRSGLSHKRHCVALHQSEWPMVSIDPTDAAYRASLQRLSDARKALLMSADQVLAAMQ